MTALAIEARRGPGRPPKYPLGTMEVGDTVYIPHATQRLINKLRSHYAPMKFKAKTLSRNGEIGVRVWRIA